MQYQITVAPEHISAAQRGAPRSNAFICPIAQAAREFFGSAIENVEVSKHCIKVWSQTEYINIWTINYYGISDNGMDLIEEFDSYGHTDPTTITVTKM